MSRLHFPYYTLMLLLYYGTEISLLSGMLCLGIVGGGSFARLVCPTLSYSVLLCQRGMQRTVVLVHVRIRIF